MYSRGSISSHVNHSARVNDVGGSYVHIGKQKHVQIPSMPLAHVSFTGVVKGNSSAPMINSYYDEQPALTLDNSCLLDRDYSLILVRKVKEFGILPNLREIFDKEGFDQMLIRYMGGFWVALEFQSIKAKDKFKKRRGVSSWFSLILPWTKYFVVDDRVIWVDIEGVPSIAWTYNSFSKIAKMWGELLYAEDLNDNNLYHKRLCRRLVCQILLWRPSN